MADKPTTVAVDDLIATSAAGVLRALEARRIGVEKISVPDLVKSGFVVDIHIICGGINPATLGRLINAKTE